MTPQDENLKESLIRLEAKIDVVLGRHEGKIDDLMQRQADASATIRDHGLNIQSNSLSIAETRASLTATQADVAGLRADLSKRSTAAASWAAVIVAGLAVVIEPIVQAILNMTR